MLKHLKSWPIRCTTRDHAWSKISRQPENIFFILNAYLFSFILDFWHFEPKKAFTLLKICSNLKIPWNNSNFYVKLVMLTFRRYLVIMTMWWDENFPYTVVGTRYDPENSRAWHEVLLVLFFSCLRQQKFNTSYFYRSGVCHWYFRLFSGCWVRLIFFLKLKWRISMFTIQVLEATSLFGSGVLYSIFTDGVTSVGHIQSGNFWHLFTSYL